MALTERPDRLAVRRDPRRFPDFLTPKVRLKRFLTYFLPERFLSLRENLLMRMFVQSRCYRQNGLHCVDT